jgi:hypothetical protein
MIINVEDSKYSITTKCPLRTNKCIQWSGWTQSQHTKISAFLYMNNRLSKRKLIKQFRSQYKQQIKI